MEIKDNMHIEVFFFVLRELYNKHRKDYLNRTSELLNSKGLYWINEKHDTMQRTTQTSQLDKQIV